MFSDSLFIDLLSDLMSNLHEFMTPSLHDKIIECLSGYVNEEISRNR